MKCSFVFMSVACPNSSSIFDPQEHLDPALDPIEGMLGMEFLALFDADLDFPRWSEA